MLQQVEFSPPIKKENPFWNVVSTTLPRLAGDAGTILLARALAPSDFGLTQLLYAAIGLCAIPGMGAGAAATYYATRHRPAACIIRALRFWLPLPALLLALCLYYARFFSGIWPPEIRLSHALPATALVMSLLAAEALYSGLLLGGLKWRLNTRARFFGAGAGLAGLAAALYSGAGLWAPLISLGTGSLALIATARRYSAAEPPQAGETASGPEVPVLKFALLETFSLLALPLLRRISLFALMLAARDPAQAGLYAAGLSVARLVTYPCVALNIWSGSWLMRAVSGRDRAEAFTAVRGAVLLRAAAAGLVLLPITFGAGPLLSAMFGPSYAAAGRTTAILSVAFFFLPLQMFLTRGLSSLGSPVKPVLLNWLTVLLQAAACAVLVPRYGMEGAAGACLLSFGTGAALAGFCFARTLKEGRVFEGREEAAGAAPI